MTQITALEEQMSKMKTDIRRQDEVAWSSKLYFPCRLLRLD